MGIDSILDKAKHHLTHIAVNKSPTFAFYRILELINRRIRLPGAVFTYSITQVFAEKYLEEHIHPNDSGVFIDVGANIGYWTKPAVKRKINKNLKQTGFYRFIDLPGWFAKWER